MSHIVRIETQVRDPVALTAACTRLGLSPPERGTFQIFSASAAGLAVRLPNWQYPLVCQIDSGQLCYDNYGGAWGDQQELDRFLQAYAIEKARLEARRAGHTVTEQSLSDGSVKLTIQVGGGS
jgi:hypothetical protein